jgi:hypothetical protein
MQNRVKHVIKKVLQNYRLNREKFVINKRLYNNQKKQNQLIIKRHLGTYIPQNPNQNNDPNPWSPFMIIMITTYITVRFLGG